MSISESLVLPPVIKQQFNSSLLKYCPKKISTHSRTNYLYRIKCSGSKNKNKKLKYITKGWIEFLAPLSKVNKRMPEFGGQTLRMKRVDLKDINKVKDI